MRILLITIISIGFHSVSLLGQGTEQDVIIIEKTIDENGNEISKKITRKKGKNFDDQELLEEDEIPFGQWDIKSLGFGPNAFNGWGKWLNDGERSSDVSIGLSLSFENGRTAVVDVFQGTGAYDSDIRAGDEIISIEGTPIISYDDIKAVLENKKAGDEIRITIYRDGTEIEKFVNLKRNRLNGFNFDLPKDMGNTQKFFFDFGNSEFGMDIDSIFKSFGTPNLDSLLKNFGFADDLTPFRSYQNKNTPKTKSSNKRASLGVMIDDESNGVTIADVLSNSAADTAGLQKGDVIERFNDNLVTSFRELTMLIGQVESGESVVLEINRSGKSITVEVIMD